jgi:hypothetical protein
VREQKIAIAKKYSDRGKPGTEKEIIRDHNSSFTSWFKDRLMANPPPMTCEEEKLIFALSHGAAPNLLTFQP